MKVQKIVLLKHGFFVYFYYQFESMKKFKVISNFMITLLK